MNKLEIIKLKFFLLVFVAFVFLIASVGVLSYDETSKTVDFSVAQVKRVSLVQDDGQTTAINLPHKHFTKNQFEYLVDIAPYKNIKDCSVTTLCNFANLDVYADDQIIYSKKSNIDDFCGSGGHYLVVFDLPDKVQSNTLRFVYQPLLESQDYTYLPIIEVAEKSDLVLKKLLGKVTLALNALLLILYLLNILYVLLLNKSFIESNNLDTIYLSILALIIAVYFSVHMWIIRYIFLPLSTLNYFVDYTALMSMPIPFLVFFRHQLDVKFKKIYSFMIGLAILNLFVQTLLAFIKVYEYVEMLLFSHLTIMASLLLVGVTFFLTDVKKYPQKKKFMYPLIIILPTAAFSVIYYLTTQQFIFNILAVVICTSFIAIEIVELFSKFKEYQDEHVEKELYKKMANTDSLTGLKNRTSYNLFVSNFDARTDNIAGWIVSLDLNDLKTINDNYGHIKGDEYIVNFANLLKREEDENSNIHAYRVGGDEFFVFIQAPQTFDVATWIERLKQAFKTTADPLEEITPSFAAGSYYLTQFKSLGFNQALHRADQKM